MLEYLEKLVGKAREATVETAEKMIKDAEDGELLLLSVFSENIKFVVNFKLWINCDNFHDNSIGIPRILQWRRSQV